MKLINLGKFNNFTNLKSSAIRGWFPLLINHDSRVRTGFGRYNLPRSISRDTSWFFWSGLHISCHMSMTGNKQIMLSPLEKNPQLYPYLGCSPRDVDGLYPYMYIYIYIHIWNNYPWISPILHMGWYWLYGFCMDHKPLTQTKLLIFGHPKSAPRNRQGRHSQDPTSCNPGVFRIRIQRSGHWTQKRSMGRLRPGAGIEGEQAGRAKAEDRNLARRSRSMFDAFRIRHASGLHGSSWFIISYITLYI